jgi:hypothetical protein
LGFTDRALAREGYYSFPLKRRKAAYIELLVFVSRCEATLLLEKKRQIAVSSILTIIAHGKGTPIKRVTNRSLPLWLIAWALAF